MKPSPEPTLIGLTSEVEKKEEALEPTDLPNSEESLDEPSVIRLLIIPLFGTAICAIVTSLDKVDTVRPPLNDLLVDIDSPALCS